jgi:hypothetical protein
MVKIRMLDTQQTVEVSRGEAHTLIETHRATLPKLAEGKPKAKKKQYKNRMMRSER